MAPEQITTEPTAATTETDPSLAIEPGERDSESIADHRAATFGKAPKEGAGEVPTDQEPPRDAQGRAKIRHKSAKDVATSAEVPRIRELTRKNKELEEQLEATKKSEPSPAARAAPAVSAAPAPATVPTVGKKPTLDEFGGDVEKWADARDQWNRDQWTVEERVRQDIQRINTSWNDRTAEAMKIYPDFDLVALGLDGTEKGKPSPIPAGSFIDMWVLESRHGAHVLYALHKDEAAEFKRIDALRRSDGQPDYVAQAEALALLGHELTTPKSSHRAEPVVPAPRPPTPVRTAPMRTAEELPGEDATLAEHAKAWGPHRRRR